MDAALYSLSGERRKRLVKLFELVFFPSFCPLCSSLLEKPGERVVCRNCLRNLRPETAAFCLCCGRFFAGRVASHPCPACLDSPPAFSRHRSACRYRGTVKDLIRLLKYQKKMVLGDDLARFLFKHLRREHSLWWGADILVPVPLHPHRLRQRGFNQAEILARRLSRLSRLDLQTKALIKVRDAAPQTTLSGEDRRSNLRGAYAVRGGRLIQGKTVILVDDVFTTGATMEECSRVLREAGAGEVRAVSIAQA